MNVKNLDTTRSRAIFHGRGTEKYLTPLKLRKSTLGLC